MKIKKRQILERAFGKASKSTPGKPVKLAPMEEKILRLAIGKARDARQRIAKDYWTRHPHPYYSRYSKDESREFLRAHLSSGRCTAGDCRQHIHISRPNALVCIPIGSV
jgi:hypothetical protein